MTENDKISKHKINKYDYIKWVYDDESRRKETLEKKAEFLLAIVSILLGSLLFNIDLVGDIANLAKDLGYPQPLWNLIKITTILVSIFLLLTLYSIFAAMSIRKYQTPSPKNFYSSLFSPSNNIFQTSDESDPVSVSSKIISISIDNYAKNNEIKEKWITIGNFSIIISTIIFCVLVAMIYSLFVIEI